MNSLKRRSTYLQLQEDKNPLPSENYIFFRRVVNDKITEAMRIIENMLIDDTEKPTESSTTFRPLGLFRTVWPTCGSLNATNGLQSVEEEARMWNEDPLLADWVFHADFVSLHREYFNYVYTFEVQWSVPTPAYPVPQVIVSVFFYVRANSTYPPEFPVDVTYRLENHQFTQDLNMVFRPKWLYDVLDMKTMMFKTFDF